MDEPSPTENLFGQLRAGDSGAARVIFNRYSQRLKQLVEHHLNSNLRARLDSEDIVQSALCTFFKRSMRGEFQIDGSLQVWQLLAHITLQRVRAKARYHQAAMRDVRIESQDTQGVPLFEKASEPDPADAVVLVETIEQLTADLPLLYRQVLERRLQGHNPEEIGHQLHVSRRTVYRALELLQQRLKRLQADADSDEHLQ